MVMKLTKFEQSGFLLETSSDFRLAFDIGNKTLLQKLDGLEGLDAFIVSHIHGDHFSPEQINRLSPKKLFLNSECAESEVGKEIKPKVTLVKVGDEIEIGGIKVKFFEVDHGPNVNHPKENMGFLIVVEGQTIYFAGDMFNPSGIPVGDLEVDIALIPVGTYYTFGPKEAYHFAKTFKKIGKIIPMHYERNDHIYPETKDEFMGLASKDFLVD
jgi:L-ascorbate metabolism protein UlaG (beta-lactamase superfamily)